MPRQHVTALAAHAAAAALEMLLLVGHRLQHPPLCPQALGQQEARHQQGPAVTLHIAQHGTAQVVGSSAYLGTFCCTCMMCRARAVGRTSMPAQGPHACFKVPEGLCSCCSASWLGQASPGCCRTRTHTHTPMQCNTHRHRCSGQHTQRKQGLLDDPAHDATASRRCVSGLACVLLLLPLLSAGHGMAGLLGSIRGLGLWSPYTDRGTGV